jgi:hypothetical protein
MTSTLLQGNTGLYQIIARNPATPAAAAAFLSGLANPGSGYTTGNYFFMDWTATKKFDKWEIRPVGFFKVQTTNDMPGGINPATGAKSADCETFCRLLLSPSRISV